MTDKQKYYALQSLICEQLQPSAIDALVAKDYPLTYAQLIQVRNGRSINLPALIALVEAGLPGYAIPAELRPAPTPQPLFS